MSGSCQWILRRNSFKSWLDDRGIENNILWLSGPPAVGKSVLASFIVDHIRQRQKKENCQHYFFVSNDQRKKTAAYFLRAMAFQIAQSNEEFREILLDLHEGSGITFGEQPANTIWLKVFEGILFKMDLGSPFYWVVDALDEADSPSQLVNIFTKIVGATPLRLLVISRMTQDISIPFHNYTGSTSIVEDTLSAEDTLGDIQAYVKHTVGTLPGDENFQLEIADKVVSKASGSFLWVTLALDSIQNNWHTEADVRKAMTELPAGMGALYVRMAQKIAAQSPRLSDMAQKILTWTACAMRPLQVMELQQALSPEFGNFVSLEDTIMQICGQFVVVEKSRVSLIHQTAVQFLLHESEGHSLPITTRSGHTYLAIACINFLSNTKWRQILISVSEHQSLLQGVIRSPVFDDHPFLQYAISSWAYHVSLASVESDQLHSLLLLFFNKYPLSWINAVALLGDLRTLTRAAQYLKTYIKRRKNKISQKPHQSLRAGETEMLRQWSIDLIRVVGKFGNNLAQSPSSIYKLIPPFCPKDSMLSRTVSQLSGSAFSVAGISSTTWDDCIARLNVGGDETASRIVCTEQYFVVLVANNGTIIVYNAEICEEKLRLRHGEYVTAMAISENHTRIATAGVHTIRVWDFAHGKLLYSLPKDDQARIMALGLTPDNLTILLGLDDCQIKCFNLSTREESWSILAEEIGDSDHSCPRVMAFSPDNSRVAMAYRGKPVVVWDLTTPTKPPRKCVRTEDRYKREGDVWNAPEVIRWHSEGSHILILYQDTVLVDWNLVEDEQVEYHHVGAREMVCASDSKFLLTSDHTGTVKIWTFPHFNLIYQLAYSEFVRDLAFSPDAKRFYDVRGSLCNVWEPDALFRSADVERDDQSSNYEASTSSDPVISGDKNDRSQVTALVCDVEDKFYCCGKDDGTVTIHEMKRGKKLRKLYGHSSTVSIVTMAWSQSSRFIASADDSGRVIVKRLERPTRQAPTKWSVYPMLNFRVEEGVQQILFSTTEQFLLVSLPRSDFVWDLTSREEVCRYQHKEKSGRKWINHPLEHGLLVWVDPIETHLHRWQGLEKLTGEVGFAGSSLELNIIPPPDDLEAFSASIGAPASGPMSPSEPAEVISWIACTRNKHFIVFEIVSNTGHKSASSAKRRVDLLSTSELDPVTKHARVRHDINALAQHMERLIGSFQDQVVFLDHQYWLCTWAVDLPVSSYMRHFFLPRDWLNIDTLDLALLNEYGTLLCPRNGEVAIVRSGIKI
jgi:WD40 repeat protein